MTDTPNQPLTDGELADRIVAAVRHGFAFAEADPDRVFPDRASAETVNAVLAAVLPELDRLRYELTERATKVQLLQRQLAEALRILDDGPQPVNNHVMQHWSVPAMRAAAVLRPGVRAVEG